MPKRIASEQRREMLRLYRKDMTYAQIMDKMGIGDLRTLKKHLALAQEEERLQQAEAGILGDAEAKHLDELSEPETGPHYKLTDSGATEY